MSSAPAASTTASTTAAAAAAVAAPVAAGAAAAPRIAGLYALTPEFADTAAMARAVTAAIEGGAMTIQYRNKLAARALRMSQATALRGVCAASRARFIVNDDVELAREVGADGVHLGRDDASVSLAREKLGSSAIIGVSCYDSLDRAEFAVAAGADYVAFGSFFPSVTKPDATPASIPMLIEARARWAIPIVAIGGINVANGGVLLAAGADVLAVVDAVFGAADVRSAAAAIAGLFALRR